MARFGSLIMYNMTLKDVLIRFKPFYKKYYKHFCIVAIGILLVSGGTSASAYMLKPILDKIFIEKNEAMLYSVPFLFVLVYFLKNVGSYLQSYYISYIGTDMLRTLRSKVLKNILYLDMSFFKNYRKGELISRCTNDIGALQSIVSNIIPDFLTQLITTLGLLGVVVYQNPKLAFFALVVLPVAIIILFYLIRKLKLYARKNQEKNSDLLSRLSEIFSNIELIKANNTENKEKEKFDKENEALCKITLKSTRINALTSPIMEITGSLGVAVVIIIGGQEVINGSMSVGGFTSFITALFWAYTPIKRLSALYGSLQGAVAASERTFYLLDLEPKIKGGEKNLSHIHTLEFKNTFFAYEKDKEVLQGVSFCLKKGEIVALIGRSGGGKSSIIGLILHFFEKNSGEILFNGEDINDFTLQSLRSKIALVTQDIYIFNDSVAANVAYSEEFSKEKVVNALKLANAYDFVEAMGGIETMLFENGKNLSGGQKQRIAIARALYKEPDLLVFDEATSALDNESEKAIVKTIENLKQNRLILIVAHRLSTVENADKIAVIEQGRVLDIGTDKELMQTCSLYQKFKNKEKQDL